MKTSKANLWAGTALLVAGALVAVAVRNQAPREPVTAAPARGPASRPAPRDAAASARKPRRIAPGGTKSGNTPGAAPAKGSFVLQNLGDIAVSPGGDAPSVGDTIYLIQHLPEHVSGDLWVQSGDGTVAKMAVCEPAGDNSPPPR